ncbi:sigma-70 family RNA polymerase sigma factor [Actinomadura sp. KC345]|uniref:sigma-70 family RNA polymerase sigma factor n=1 Tax=Actinomadura sp. KC345 TaxID=2530371 RepID=UPI001404FBB0|nr:sigma-70 family RNA polymerase sigma factor [Actinomadura sp. KC345]
MNTAQSISAEHPAREDFHTRNGELFARRKVLLEQLAAVRTMMEAGEPDTGLETALRRAQHELEDITLEIVQLNLGLVRRYVAIFTYPSGEHVEDFESAGKMGLLWAISSYDPARGSLAQWAFKPIQREVLRAVRDAEHPNLAPGDFEKRPAILAAKQAILEETGPDAAVDHTAVARRAGVTEAQARRVLNPPRIETLHPLGSGQGDEFRAPENWLADSSPSTEDRVLLRLDLSALGDGLPHLHRRERYVLVRRFGLDGEPEQSLRVIGERLGLSPEGVRLIERKALTKLGETIADTSPEPGDVSDRRAHRAPRRGLS